MGDNVIQEFEIGQKVLIIGAGDEQDDFEYAVCFVRPEMSNLVGRTATISNKLKNRRYGRFVYGLQEFSFKWADKWLEPLYNTNDFIYK